MPGRLRHLCSLVAALALVSRAEGADLFVVSRADSLPVSLPALARDAQGDPWIAYFDEGRAVLKVARRSQERWVLQTVDVNGNAGYHSAIAMDASGRPAIVYGAHLSDGPTTETSLRLARLVDGIWRREHLLTSGQTYSETSIDVDHQGILRCAAKEGSNVILVEQRAGVWQKESVFQSVAGGRPALRSSANGVLFIAGLMGRDVFLASRPSASPGIWAGQLVPGGRNSSTPSLAIDSSGSPWLSFFANGQYVVTHRTAGGWVSDTLETAAPGADVPSLVLDAQDRPWVAIDRGSGEPGLRLWGRVDGRWESWFVDGGEIGYPALKLDEGGAPSLAYVGENPDNGRQYVQYADASLRLREPLGAVRWPAGSIQNVHFDGLGPIRVELAREDGDPYQELATAAGPGPISVVVPEWTTERARLRIVRDELGSSSENPGFLEIAPELVSPWWGETVDEEGFAGRHADIAWAARGPAIAYRSYQDGRLRVARRHDAGWRVEDLGSPSFGEGGLAWAHGSLGTWLAAAGEEDLALYHWPQGAESANVERVPQRARGAVAATLDASGAPHVAFYDELGVVRLLSRNGDGWAVEDIHDAGAAGTALDLRVDDAGELRCVLFDAAQNRMLLATRDGGIWTESQIPTRGLRPAQVGLEFPNGNLLVAGSFWNDGSARSYEWEGTRWEEGTIAGSWSADQAFDCAVGPNGEPWAVYAEAGGGRVWVARRQGGMWSREPADDGGRVGEALSLAVDAAGRPRGAYFDIVGGGLRYFSSAVELVDFRPDEAWLAKPDREVRWRGTGRVTASWVNAAGEPVGEPVTTTTGLAVLGTPPGPRGSLRLRLARPVPSAETISDPLPPFPGGVALLAWRSDPSPLGGLRLEWSTWPALPEILGYRLERRLPGGAWTELVASLADTAFRDPEGVLGARYRLSARDADAVTHEVAERLHLPPERLTVWPTVWSSGALGIGLRVAPGEESGALLVRDVRGRRVARLHAERLPAGEHTLEWEGRDEAGREVPPGVYFVEWRRGETSEARRVVRIR